MAFEKQQRKSMYTAHKRGEGAGEMTYQRALEAIQVPGSSKKLDLSLILIPGVYFIKGFTPA